MSTLIKTQEELQNMLAVSVGLQLDVLEPYLSNSFAEKELKKVLGSTTYDALLTAYTAGSLTDHQTALLPYVQKPLANLAVWDWSQVGQVSVGSMGFQTLGSKDKVAFRYQSESFQRGVMRHGFDALEDLITFLEKNATNYSAWKTDSEYASLTQFFINRASEFQKYVNINSSRRLLVAMWPVMKFIEETKLQTLLTAPLYAALKAAIKAGNPIGDETELISRAQPVLAHLSIAEAITELSLSVTEEGAFVQYANSGSGEVTGTGRNAASDARLDRYASSHKAKGESYLELLRDYLNTNATSTKYTDYYNSTNYTDPADYSSGYEQELGSNTYNAL